MDSRPKISVIIPMYNVEQYLQRCVESVLAQTYQDIEIILVNDGSTDRSGTLAEELAAAHPGRLAVFHKANGGLSDARNYGIDHAAGDYLAFVDSDDYISPGMLEDMYSLASRHDADIVICNLQKVDEQGAVTQRLPQMSGYPECIDFGTDQTLFADIGFFACNKIFRRSLFDKFRFRRGIHFEDIELIPRLFLQSKTIAYSSGYHYQYFERANSISKTHNLKGLDMLDAVETVTAAYKTSEHASKREVLKGFQILQGVYSFLAYAAFIKDPAVAEEFRAAYRRFCTGNQLKIRDILSYRRFGKNYFLGLPLKKKVFYAAYFLGVEPPTIHRLLEKF